MISLCLKIVIPLIVFFSAGVGPCNTEEAGSLALTANRLGGGETTVSLKKKVKRCGFVFQ